MADKIRDFKEKYKKNPGWYWLMATVFLFPLLPEYISPFILVAGFVIFKRQWTREGRKAKVGTLGKLEIAFMSLALISVLWSHTPLDTLGTAGLWWGMFLVQVMIYNLCTTRLKIDKIFNIITISAAINGAVGSIQLSSYMLNNFNYIPKFPDEIQLRIAILSNKFQSLCHQFKKTQKKFLTLRGGVMKKYLSLSTTYTIHISS